MPANIQDFKPLDSDGQVEALANLLPNGYLWQAKNNKASNVYKLLLAMSKEFGRLDSAKFALASEFIPSANMGYLEQWERFLGIPDDCFRTDVPDNFRRTNIIAKLGYLNLFVKQDYYDLAELYGLTITAFDNSTFGEIYITINVSSGEPLNKFDNILFDPLIDPEGAWIFGSEGEEFFVCILKNYTPAYVQISINGVAIKV